MKCLSEPNPNVKEIPNTNAKHQMLLLGFFTLILNGTLCDIYHYLSCT